MKNLEIRRVILLLLVIAISIFLSLVGCTHNDVPDAGQSDGATESNAPVTEIEPIETEPANTGTVDTDNVSNSKYTIPAGTEPVETESPIIFTTEELQNWAKSCGILESIGAEDRSFDSLVTRAEFVKMLMTAVYLTPDSEIAEFLSNCDPKNSSDMQVFDLEDHWLTEQGYTRLAINFGLIQRGELGEGFRPDSSINRYDAAILTARVSGFGKQANSYDYVNNTQYNDVDSGKYIGVIRALTNVGILQDYGKSFKGEEFITLEEACEIILRAVKYTESGEKLNSKVIIYQYAEVTGNSEMTERVPYGQGQLYFYKIGDNLEPSNSNIVEISPTLRIVDGIIYISVRDLLEVAKEQEPYVTIKWDADNISVEASYCVGYMYFTSGKEFTGLSKSFPIRMYRGEILVPVQGEIEGVYMTWCANEWTGPICSQYSTADDTLYIDLPSAVTPNS
ncbi:MAG: hypothetical protein E7627_06260 [Ruminococcaceae bacterium]|nr:hypothetical protein [Oscillospiraceae bacterium]